MPAGRMASGRSTIDSLEVLIDLTVEALLAVKVWDFIVLSTGPFVDLGLWGRYDTDGPGGSRTQKANATSFEE